MNIGLGNNYLLSPVLGHPTINCGGLLVKAEVDSNGTILAAVNLWDEHGERIGKLRRSAWSFKADGYEVRTNPNHLMMTKGDRVHLEIKRTQEMLWFERIDLYSPSGERVVIRDGIAGEELGAAKGALGCLEVWAPNGKRHITLSKCKWIAPECALDIDPSGTEVFAWGGGIVLNSVNPFDACFTQCEFSNPRMVQRSVVNLQDTPVAVVPNSEMK